MAKQFPRDRPHLLIVGQGRREPYRRPNQQQKPPALPSRDRVRHALALETSIALALENARRRLAHRNEELAVGIPGFYLDIEMAPGQRVGIDQLADRRKLMEVVAVRDAVHTLSASVFVPRRAQSFYLEKVRAYRSSETPTGRPRNEELITRMEAVSLATVRSLFTDPLGTFPEDPRERIWWEIWLRTGRREAFDQVADALEIPRKQEQLRFPERVVVLALCDSRSLDRLMIHSDVVAELRRAKDTPSFFMGLKNVDQRDWSAEAVSRLYPPVGAQVAVTVLDSGIRRVHPIVAPLLAPEDGRRYSSAFRANFGRKRHAPAQG